MEQIHNLLKSHGITFNRLPNNTLLILDEYTINGVLKSNYVNATNWSYTKITHWLGY